MALLRGGDASPIGWRQATAARVFIAAIVVGQALSSNVLTSTGPLIVVLCIIGATAIAIDSTIYSRWARWVSIPEAALVASVLGLAQDPSIATLFLVSPLLSAGLRAGAWSVTTSFLVTLVALIGAGQIVDGEPLNSINAWPFVSLGLAAGYIASWQSRRARAAEESNRPAIEIHRLVAQLHDLASTSQVDLDTGSAALDLASEVAAIPETGPTWVVVGNHDRGWRPLATTARKPFEPNRFAASLATPGAHEQVVEVPNDLEDSSTYLWIERAAPEQTGRYTELVDKHSFAVGAALLFEQVRHGATAEERERIAREIHDGVAQDIASLGYLVDAAAEDDGELAKESLGSLRQEITRVVGELRRSVFELRNPTEEDFSIRDELARMVEQVARETAMATALECDPRANELPEATQTQLFAISREAIGNAKRHSGGNRLEVSLLSDGGSFALEIADDGSQSTPVVKDGHYGLLTMKERADKINAEFSLLSRPGGGTMVRVTFPRGN